MQQIRLSLAALVLAILPGYLQASPVRVHLSGSSTVAPLVAELAKGFEAKESGIQIEVQAGGSAKGIMDCRRHLTDLGMISRDPKPNESDLKTTAIARDGLAFIVHKTNPITNLTREQIIQIYSGKITNWKVVGGADQSILVMNKAEGRATLDLFKEYFGLKASEIRATVVIGDEEQGVKTIAGSPSSIGYLSLSTVNVAIKSQSGIKALALDGASPSVEGLKDGTYKLSRSLHVISCGKAQPPAEKFLEYIVSPDGQKIVEDLNYLSI